MACCAPWLVIFTCEDQPPVIHEWDTYEKARRHYERLAAGWTGVDLVRRVVSSSYQADEQPPPLSADAHIGATTQAPFKPMAPACPRDKDAWDCCLSPELCGGQS